MNLSKTVNFFLSIQSQLKVNHWQTKKYGRHQAYGQAYDDFSELTDEFLEVAMYKYGRFNLSDEDKTLEIYNLNDLSIKEMIDKSVMALMEFDNELSDKDTDLLNLRDELVAVLNKMGYLLTME